MDENTKNNHTKILAESEDKKVNTVIIGGWSSRCGNCNGNAFPDEGFHKTIKYDNKDYVFVDKLTGDEKIIEGEPGVEGCGTKWLYMYSDYWGDDVKETCIKTWPQYEWIGQ